MHMDDLMDFFFHSEIFNGRFVMGMIPLSSKNKLFSGTQLNNDHNVIHTKSVNVN